MSRAVEYLISGRRRGRLGQAVVPDILRDTTAESGGGTDIMLAEPTAPAAPEPGFLGLPVIFWVAVLGGLVLVTSGRRGR